MHRQQLRLLILCATIGTAGCSREACPPPRPDCPPGHDWSKYADPAIEAQVHVGRAALQLLRRWNELDAEADAAPRRVLGNRIRTLIVWLCDGPLADWRIDIAATPLEEFFDLSLLAKADRVDCVGLVVDGRIETGPAFRRPK